MPASRPVRLAGLALVLSGLAGSGLVAASGPAGPPPPPDQAAARVLAAAREQIGDSYEWAGTGPDVWDCSGLTSVMWRTAGGAASIPRTSRQQQAWATPIRAEDALPGDLVFFGEPVGHVSLYLGDGRILDASSSRKSVLERAVWTSDVVRYGRVPRPTAPKSRPVEPTPARADPTEAPSSTPSASPTTRPAPSRPTSGRSAPSARTTPSATPSTSASAGHAGAGRASKPSSSPSAHPSTAAASPRPVPQPGHQPRAEPRATAAAFAAAARSAAGAAYQAGRSGPTYDAPGLVRMAWWKVTKRVLPADPAAVERLTKPVTLADLTVGDLIFYGAPAVHVGVYVGDGEMVDASKVLKRVSQRRVFSSDTVRFARLTV
ncbi:MAG TPA: NlpC/P60 family protein [Mycobacteriales bacterium]|nr:NlpC/P60 family protein [Mycobacteriales bacterium]